MVGVDASMVHISVQTEEQPTEISLGSSESNTVVKLVIKIDAIDVETRREGSFQIDIFDRDRGDCDCHGYWFR